MKTDVHFSSASDQWATPQDFFDRVVKRLGPFDLDAAANETNAKVHPFLSDALRIRWRDKGRRIWLNPPYGRAIKLFMEKAVEAHLDGCLVVCLVPARTDTNWWHDFVIPYAKIEFIRGRLKFNNHENAAPFPNALVIYEEVKGVFA